MNRTSLWLLAMLLGAIVAVPGCSDDDPVTPDPPVPGTISILYLPDTIDASWELTGPDDYQHEGTGPAELDEMVPGDYTLTWGEVAHCVRPDPASTTQTLVEDGTLTFTGMYVADPGTVVVDPLILAYTIHAPWQITGPGGFSASGLGRAEFTDRAVGSYSVTWGAYGSGTQVPDPATQIEILAPADTLTFAGTYTGLSLDSPDGAMQLFREFYGNRTIDGYAAILSDDFMFVGQHGTAPGNRDDEIAIATKMFSGEPGDGDYRILHISIGQLEPQSVWEPTPPDDVNFGLFVGSMRRNYLVDISFVIADVNLILRVQGPVRIYTNGEIGDGGSEHRLLGIVDATFGDKATETISWTQVREMFR